MIESGDIDLMRSNCDLIEKFISQNEKSILDYFTKESSDHIIDSLFSKSGVRLLVFDLDEQGPLLYNLSWDNFTEWLVYLAEENDGVEYECTWVFDFDLEGIPEGEEDPGLIVPGLSGPQERPHRSPGNVAHPLKRPPKPPKS